MVKSTLIPLDVIGLGLPPAGAQHQVKAKAIVGQLVRAQLQESRQVVGALSGNSINLLFEAYRVQF